MISRLRVASLTGLILMTLFGLSASLHAQTLNVGPGQTYTTIQSAIAAASDGMTVLVAPGTYNEDIDFLGKYITVTSSGGASVTTINGSSASTAPAVTISPENAQHAAGVLPIVLSGFTIENGGGTTPSTTPTGGVYVYILGPTISNNVITQNHCAGIWIETYIASAVVSNNVITGTRESNSDCAVGGGAGIVVTDSGLGGIVPPYAPPIITGNMIHDNVEGGQSGTGGGGLSLLVPATVQNNKIYNNVSISEGGGLYLGDSGVIVVQNLIYDNQAGCGGGGIAVQRLTPNYILPLQILSNTLVDNSTTQPCTGFTAANASQLVFDDPELATNPAMVVNNILSGTSTVPAVACNSTEESSSLDNVPVIDHNLIFNAGGQDLDTTCSDPLTGYGNVFNVAPGFVNPLTDYHLLTGSPAIDTGNTTEILQEVTTPAAQVNNASDFDGNTRVVDATGKGYAVVDMGAYEFAGASSPQTTTVALTTNGLATYYPVETALPDTETVFVATVSSPVSPAGCTGVVTFIEDGQAVGTATLNGSVASFPVLLAPGVHRFTATYPGVSPCSPGVGVEIIYLVSKYVTELTLTSSANPVLLGQPVTFTTTLASADPNQPGPILLKDSETLLASQTPVSHVAMYTTSTLTLGGHGISAAYMGDADHYPALTVGLEQYVVNALVPTSVAVTSSSNPSLPGQDVYFYANVASSAGTPTGSVTFSEGATTYSTQMLVNGAAQFSISTLSPGFHTITATYSPTEAFSASSGSIRQHVTSQTTTTLVITAAGVVVTTVPAKTAVTLTATTMTFANPVTPGQVNFCDATSASCTDVHLLGTAQLSSTGIATFKFVPGAGSHSYKAVFIGTNIDSGSTSAAMPLFVVAATGPITTTVGISASGGQGDYALLGTVATNGPTSPTGTISFLDTDNTNYVLGASTLGPTGSDGISFYTSEIFPLPGVQEYFSGAQAVADFNGDGVPDLLVTNSANNTIYVLLGNGDGTFTASGINPSAGSPVQFIATGDFNHDGNIDFVIEFGFTFGAEVYLGKGDGTFTPGQIIDPPDGFGMMVVTDFNGDGILDIAESVSEASPGMSGGNCFSGQSNCYVQIYLGNGDGTFTAMPTRTPSNFVTGMITADFNGDGKLDIVVGSNTDENVVLLLGNGDGTFTSSTILSGASFGPLAAADLTGNGKVDIVAAYGTSSGDGVAVLLGNGDGTFGQLSNDPAFNQPAASIAVGDFNGDGIPDLVLPNIEGGYTSVFLGKGDGTFVPDSFSPSVANFIVESIGIADFNGDGQSDIAEEILDNRDVTPMQNQLDVLLAQSPSTAAGYAYNISPVGTGFHYVDASYPGDANNAAGLSVTIPLIAQQVTTNLTLTVSPSGGSSTGQPVTLSASLDQFLAQNHYASRDVTFTSNGKTLGMSPVQNDGTATLNTIALIVGTDKLKAVYPGDINFLGSTSAIVSYSVSPQVAQTITFPQPVTPAFAGTSVTLAATASSGLPVTYTVLSGPAAVSGSTLSYTGVGAVMVEADQAGNASFTAATAVKVSVQVVELTEPVGTSSPAITTVVTFTTAGTLGSIAVLTQGAVNLDFKFVPGGTCAVGTAYAVADTCTVAFSFTPTRPGTRYGGIALNTSAGTLLANSYIFGLGVGPMVDWMPGTQRTIATSDFPDGIAMDGNGNLYFADEEDNVVKELVAVNGRLPAVPTERIFSYSLNVPTYIAVDGSGNLFVSESGFNRVDEFEAVNGVIPTSQTARFVATSLNQPQGIAVDGLGNIFVANDFTYPDLNQVPDVVEIQAVNGVIPPSPPIRILTTSLPNPLGLALDGTGNIYVTDLTNDTVSEIMAVNGTIPASPAIRTVGSSFMLPFDVKVDTNGNVFVLDLGAESLKEVVAVDGSVPSSPTILTLETGLNGPQGMALDTSGNVYVSNTNSGTLLEFDYADPPSLTFATTPVGSTSSDSPQSVTLTNNGNADLVFAIPASGSNPAITPGFTIDSSSTCPQLTTSSSVVSLAASGSCIDAIDFTPIAAGADNGTLVTTDNNLNVAGTSQTVMLNATGSQGTPRIDFAVANQTFGNPPFTVAATSNSTGAFTYTVVSGPATIAGSTVTLTGAGPVVLEASQAATANYTAGSVTAMFNVAREAQLIDFPAPPASVHLGSGPVVLMATASSRLPVAFSVVSGPGTLVGNSLTLTAIGTVVVAANQAGNTNFSPAPTVQRGITVTAPAVSVQLTAAPNPVFVTNPVTLTAMLSVTSGMSGAPTGTVTFEDGTSPLGTVAVSNGVAAISVSTLAMGFHALTAVYNGNAQLGPATSSPVVELVEDFALTAVHPGVTIDHGGTATYSLTLGAVGGVATAGAVSFNIAGAPEGSVISLTPATVENASPTTPVTLTIQTPNYPVGPWNAASVGSTQPQIPSAMSNRKNMRVAWALLSFGAGFLMFGRRRRTRMKWLASALVVLAAASLSGCGSGWKTQQYTIVVTATSGNLTHATTLSLTTECADGKSACQIVH